MRFSDEQCSEACDFLISLGVNGPLLARASFRLELERYLGLLLKKNEELNLTSLRDPNVAFWKHIVDSLTILQWEPMGSVIDWGSGGGLPGIPLALARRELEIDSPVHFLDSVGKKLRAIEEFGNELGLKSSQYFNGRGEDFLKAGKLAKVDAVLMRAVAPAERAVEWLNRSVPRWIYLLGPQQLDLWLLQEKRARTKGFQFGKRTAFDLPHEHGQRVLLELVRI